MAIFVRAPPKFCLMKIVATQFNMKNPFNPFGWTSDNAGGLLEGLRMMYKRELRHRTCRFHFLYCAFQHCGSAIGSYDDQLYFLRYCRALLDAATPTLYERIYEVDRFWL